MNTFGSNLKRLRSQRNIKQEDLAGRMNVTRQTVSGWETGRRQPDLDTLKTLAEVLDVDIHELIYGSKPEAYPKYQRRYVIQTAVCGGIVAALSLFRLLVWPYVKVMCATFHQGLFLTICYTVLPKTGAFSFGFLLPALVQLFVPIRMEKRRAKLYLITGLMALFPVILFWAGISPWCRWILYPAGNALLSYILPCISGICISLGSTYKSVWVPSI